MMLFLICAVAVAAQSCEDTDKIKKWQAVREIDESLLNKITVAAKFYQKSISYGEIGDTLKSSTLKKAYEKSLTHLDTAFENKFCNHYKRFEPVQQLIEAVDTNFDETKIDLAIESLKEQSYGSDLTENLRELLWNSLLFCVYELHGMIEAQAIVDENVEYYKSKIITGEAFEMKLE
ncbi:Oidioi.mRNA.OKI2018_I69.chr2.g4246.t1.cds [Oikopleura dioica]|uniref:Oidioi.mRNA.OKI2018_I69.chr2.g4246.t1.cds n=1 Tax=Oikopleura dioica TaxID=34765 RepID=A0ABN7T291_OIKDI|nr:Oidioi.mRNA.OKI2018_I69.chr2.g4246.t1.cds [Oikopleura dioica]